MQPLGKLRGVAEVTIRHFVLHLRRGYEARWYNIWQYCLPSSVRVMRNLRGKGRYDIGGSNSEKLSGMVGYLPTGRVLDSFMHQHD